MLYLCYQHISVSPAGPCSPRVYLGPGVQSLQYWIHPQPTQLTNVVCIVVERRATPSGSGTDKRGIQKIIEAISVTPGEPILGLCPKDGPLTRSLVESKAKLTVIERETYRKGNLEDYLHNVSTSGYLLQSL